MDYWSEDDNDISWLTQVQSIESQKANFEVFSGQEKGEGSLFKEIFGDENGQCEQSQIVSLEENVTIRNGKVLYDNVVAEDISSDEGLDRL